ncbi:AAA family ATPase [Lentzea sp.]|uniref:AAA family ATPase n=1 Tax=Lentzea sp. TaxID=56099 RepID=UPI002ED190B4
MRLDALRRALAAEPGRAVAFGELIDAVWGAALAGTAPVLAITGPPGVGKTSLAVHVAHRLVERFPDGQLHVNLRAFDDATALTPHQALHRFLRALGAEDVPADRAVLVMIDNATGDLVGPLLPGGRVRRRGLRHPRRDPPRPRRRGQGHERAQRGVGHQPEERLPAR